MGIFMLGQTLIFKVFMVGMVLENGNGEMLLEFADALDFAL